MAAPMTTNSRPLTSPSGSVLVVEDNTTTRERISNVLRSHGYGVTEAIDGLDALKKVSARPFDAILLDLVMPHVDGWQFRATQLRHPELAVIPTVIVTVQPLREPDRYALQATDIVHKPFEDAALVQAVQRACRIRQPLTSPSDAPVRGLFWSRRGEVACGQHAPEPTSSRWREERWGPVVIEGTNSRVAYQCQHCPGHSSAIDRSRRGGKGKRGASPSPPLGEKK